MSTHSFDLAIIGSGSGNSLVTPYWDDKSVAIFEAGVFGGTCLNRGCIPTKMFAYPAALAASPAEAARLGVDMSFTAADWPAIRDRIFTRIDAISNGGRTYRAETLDNTTLFEEEAHLDGPGRIVTASGQQIEAKQIVLAAGSRPQVPAVPGVDLPQVHTSDTIMRLAKLPQRLLVLGGGYIAAEFASIFSGLGSQVVQVTRSNQLLRQHDATVSQRFTDEARKQWDLKTGWTLAGIESGLDGWVTAQFHGPTNTTWSVEADAVLIAHGRTPNSDRLGTESLDIDLHEDGRVAVDEFQRVLAGGQPVEGLWALGDISSPWQLKHVANHEQRLVSHNLEHPEDLRANTLGPVPAAVFARPEVAAVGMTEEQAVAEYGTERITVKVQEMGDVAYGWAMEDVQGFCKIIADRQDGTILGAHIMGHDASNLIQPLVQAMSFGLTAHQMARGQYWPHPALSEVIENALLGLAVPDSGLL